MTTIGVCYDLDTDYEVGKGEPVDANAEFDAPATVDHLVAAVESLGFSVDRIGNAWALMARLPDLEPDLVFNICEGRRGRNRESQVPILLEMHDIPYVGSDALTQGLTLDKVVAKQLLAAEGLPTPRHAVASSVHDLGSLHLKYPLFVKPRWEGSSKGLTRASRVCDRAALERQVISTVSAYGQPALIEEFIHGSEFTVALVGNDPVSVLPPVQVEIDGRARAGDSFFRYEHVLSDGVRYICRTDTADSLMAELMDLALRTYRLVGCVDFGRVDFRVDSNGRPYILEINALPSLATEDVFGIVAEAVGCTYEGMIERIIDGSMSRHGMHRS